jgi:hypothetical protein
VGNKDISGKCNVIADALSHNPVPVADIFQLVASRQMYLLVGQILGSYSKRIPSSLLPCSIWKVVLSLLARKLSLLAPNFTTIDGVLYLRTLIRGKMLFQISSSSLY